MLLEVAAQGWMRRNCALVEQRCIAFFDRSQKHPCVRLAMPFGRNPPPARYIRQPLQLLISLTADEPVCAESGGREKQKYRCPLYGIAFSIHV
jgi:hypothetical protein